MPTNRLFPHINLSDYEYHLPEEKIAKFPLAERDSSKLLVYKAGEIQHKFFQDIENELDENHTLFFNNTKVIPARLYFQKETGAIIEIFLLQPISPVEVHQAMLREKTTTWACAIGNLKRWKEDSPLQLSSLIEGKEMIFQAHLVDREKQIVRFEWEISLSFAEILANIGNMPLPPYLKRAAEAADNKQYQTVYAAHKGAVAAPTAGLHFTPELLQKLADKGVKQSQLTLHVGGGTFQPIRTDTIEAHQMHAEQMLVTKENLQAILSSKSIVAVGTTSMRTLESLYWFGVKLSYHPQAHFEIKKLYPYSDFANPLPSLAEAIALIQDYMEINQLTILQGSTEIMIVPSYQFRVCDGLVTNFHLPGTTLMLLVAAFVGDNWQKIYESALRNEYRFLSFGDSSLLWKK